MAQEQKLFANFNCYLIIVNNQLTFLYRNQLNNKVLQLQVNFRCKIGKNLMTEVAQLERR